MPSRELFRDEKERHSDLDVVSRSPARNMHFGHGTESKKPPSPLSKVDAVGLLCRDVGNGKERLKKRAPRSTPPGVEPGPRQRQGAHGTWPGASTSGGGEKRKKGRRTGASAKEPNKSQLLQDLVEP